MRFGTESNLFGNAKNDSFEGSIGTIYQSFNGSNLSYIEVICSSLIHPRRRNTRSS